MGIVNSNFYFIILYFWQVRHLFIPEFLNKKYTKEEFSNVFHFLGFSNLNCLFPSSQKYKPALLKNWIQVTWQPSKNISGQELVITNYLQNMSKWFHIIKKQPSKLKNLGFHSRKHSSLLAELWEKKLVPVLSSIQYQFMDFVSKLLLIIFITMHHQVMGKGFYCACV